ncbi:MAG: class I SAM-dependent methyltransferase [Candidatus Pacebacteria bacterium]|nr:class I SAM-dependent methyltransferase [Candidatus Paceibacterota bacterium]
MQYAEYENMHRIEQSHFWFVAKRFFLKHALRHANKRLDRLDVLDVGCGSGAVMEFFNQKGHRVYGVDISPTALAFCEQKGLTVKEGTATHLPFGDQSFDVVCALDVVEHIAKEEDVIREIERVLRPGGVGIITVPAHQWLWSYHDELLGHQRRYNKKQLTDVVSPHLDIVHYSWIHATSLVPIIISRLVKKILAIRPRTSDVKPIHPAINGIFKTLYVVENVWYALFKALPFGLSLIIVGKKKER